MLSSYRKLHNSPSLIPQSAVDLAAFFVSGKCPLCLTFIAVHLPAPATFTILPRILDEPDYILQWIPQKYADLMRKSRFHVLQALLQSPDRLIRPHSAVAILP